MKALFITEKPSVAREFAAALNINAKNRDGYMEGDKAVITWCVGHLVTMSYPDQYDPTLKKWDLETIPFIPDTFKYETIPGVQKQFDIVSSLLNREDIDTIYVCTDSGREGEYIYRLVDQMDEHNAFICKAMCKANDVHMVDKKVVHWMSHSQVDMFIFMVTHIDNEKEALAFAEKGMEYLIAGWYAIVK